MKNSLLKIVFAFALFPSASGAQVTPAHDVGERAATQSLTDAISADMIDIPAGSFNMGDDKGTGFNFERPAHRVSISTFKLARHDVTFSQYDVFAQATGRALPEQRAGLERGNYPVVNVSWADAQAFVDWLNSVSGRKYRLPSEAEWEYAARAGSTAIYPWGDRFDSDKANAAGKKGADIWDATAPVGSFPPNAFGLYDMVGNVWQWMADCAHLDYDGAPNDGSAWTMGDCSWRNIRGGSWVQDPRGLRVSLRLWEDTPRRRFQSLGFRIAESE